MAKSTLAGSTLSLGRGEKEANRADVTEAEDFEGSFRYSVDCYVSKRRKRWTPQKSPSLGNLTTQSYDSFQSYAPILNIPRPLIVSLSQGKTVVWKAYCKFIKGAWRKTSSLLLSQTQKADSFELQERSALIQMSSISALLSKDKEIIGNQTSELNQLSRMLSSIGNEKNYYEEENLSLQSELENLIEDVGRLDQELAGKQEAATQLENELDELEKSLSKKEDKRDKYRIEVGIKQSRVEQLTKECELNGKTIQRLKQDLIDVEHDKSQHLNDLNDIKTHLTALRRQNQQETDEFGILKKKLAEIKETSQIAAQELTLMQLRLIDQDLNVAELEKQLSLHLKELENLKALAVKNGGKWDKLFYGVWAAACLVQVIRFVDRRWP